MLRRFRFAFLVLVLPLNCNATKAEDLISVNKSIPPQPMNRLMGLFDARPFPGNYTIYGLNIRENSGTTAIGGQGLFLTCDSGEIAVGAFCEEKMNGDSTPNALLDAGVKTPRSIACRWKNPGQYRVVASCLNITALKGDVKRGVYTQGMDID